MLFRSLLIHSAKLETEGLEGIREICPEGYGNVKQIMDVIKSLEEAFTITFDHTLVRGMGYYTSTIFEITYGDLGYAIAGGGRYDKMIGKISGVDVPAVGFSIGFERIVDLLIAENKVSNTDEKIALIYGEEDDLVKVVKSAIHLRESMAVV